MTHRAGEGYTYRYSNQLKKLLSAKGGEPAPELSPEIIAAIVLEEDRPESWAIGDTHPWQLRVLTAAGVGLNSGAGIRNPSGSGVICVVRGWSAPSVAAQEQIQVIPRVQSASGVIGTGGVLFRDSRDNFNAFGPILAMNLQLAAIVGGVYAVHNIQANGPELIVAVVDYILGPGAEFTLWRSDGQNLPFDASFWGYYRTIEDSELKTT